MAPSRGHPYGLAALAAILACGGDPSAAPRGGPDTLRVALNDLGTGTYLGFTGGLYPNSSNAPPARHDSVGLARARAIVPLDGSGAPSPDGMIVLMSVGMSNTTQEFCSASATLPCDAWSFMGLAAADPAVRQATLVIVNGARGGQAASTWDQAADPNYDRVRDSVLTPQGLTEKQVQIVWVKQANPGPSTALPAPQADAYALETSLGGIVRALKTRYPNLQQVFLSSRTYGGYATTTLNPEPYAYESGFSVAWLIRAQIDQMAGGGTVIDARAGDLDYDGAGAWLAWGPYLWAHGTNARSDGLTWSRSDFVSDGTHPSQSGRQKVGTMLLAFFTTSSYTRCWFVTGGTCP